MAVPERDTVYTSDGTNRTTATYTRESSATGWFVGIIVALALLAIGYLVFSANSGPAPTTNVDVNNTPAVTETTPMVEAPAAGTEAAPATGTETTPMAPADAAPAEDAAPAAPAAPADDAAPAATDAETVPAT